MTSALNAACIRSPTGALLGRAVKGAPSLTTHGLAKMSSDSRPQSETGRKSRMSYVSGDVSKIPRLTSMKRGGGHRSSFSGRVTTVFGATGALGSIICNNLGKQGSQIIVPYRGDHYEAMKLKVCGDLGQVLFTEYNLKDDESIRNAIKYSDTVINLVGREWETRNFSFWDVNVDGPQRLARLSREAGVRDFIHISHINAREKPDTIWSKGSKFLKTKWEGERAVFDEFPDATIFRPVEMIGSPDYFTHYYIASTRKCGLAMPPLWRHGKYTVKQPIAYTDLGHAIMNALDDPFAKGKIFDAMGQNRYVLPELLNFMAVIYGQSEAEIVIKDMRKYVSPFLFAAIFQTAVWGQKYVRGCTFERLERTQLSDQPESRYDISDLGVVPEDIRKSIIEATGAIRWYGMKSQDDWGFVQLHPILRAEEETLKDELQESNLFRNLIGATR